MTTRLRHIIPLVQRSCIALLAAVLPLGCTSDGVPAPAKERTAAAIESDADLHRAEAQLASDSSDVALLRTIWDFRTRNKSYDEVARSAEAAYARAGADADARDSRLAAWAAAYAAQSYLMMDQEAPTGLWLARAFECLADLPDGEYALRRTVYNVAGIEAIKGKADYSTALGHFKTALAAAEQLDDPVSEGALLRNIAHIYDMREDVSGFDYALRSYRLARQTENVNARSLAALVLSTMYKLKGDYAAAFRYADESIAHIDEAEYHPENKAYAYYNYGDICAAAGDDEGAERFYRLAMEHLDDTDTDVRIRTCASFADLKMKQHRYDEAIGLYAAAERLFNHGNKECQARVLSGLAHAYDASGDGRRALDYYKKYFDSDAETINFRQENAFRDLLMKYAESEHRHELDRKQTELLRKDKKILAMASLTVIVGLLLIGSWLLYRRKNAMYGKLVMQNLAYRQRLAEYRRCEELKQRNRQQAHLHLYEALERLMKEQRLYRRRDLTIQMLAEMLGTNTTYLSDAVNRFSGKSLPNYLNAYRIEEVQAALSDPANDEPINVLFERAGYASRTTYTRIFRKETGLTPTEFRQTVRKIRVKGSRDIKGSSEV